MDDLERGIKYLEKGERLIAKCKGQLVYCWEIDVARGAIRAEIRALKRIKK